MFEPCHGISTGAKYNTTCLIIIWLFSRVKPQELVRARVHKKLLTCRIVCNAGHIASESNLSVPKSTYTNRKALRAHFFSPVAIKAAQTRENTSKSAVPSTLRQLITAHNAVSAASSTDHCTLTAQQRTLNIYFARYSSAVWQRHMKKQMPRQERLGVYNEQFMPN